MTKSYKKQQGVIKDTIKNKSECLPDVYTTSTHTCTGIYTLFQRFSLDRQISFVSSLSISFFPIFFPVSAAPEDRVNELTYARWLKTGNGRCRRRKKVHQYPVVGAYTYIQPTHVAVKEHCSRMIEMRMQLEKIQQHASENCEI